MVAVESYPQIAVYGGWHDAASPVALWLQSPLSHPPPPTSRGTASDTHTGRFHERRRRGSALKEDQSLFVLSRPWRRRQRRSLLARAGHSCLRYPPPPLPRRQLRSRGHGRGQEGLGGGGGGPCRCGGAAAEMIAVLRARWSAVYGGVPGPGRCLTRRRGLVRSEAE